ncbi:MAG: hypothetical protein RR328_05895, partial [Bacteroidales bacterium]
NVTIQGEAKGAEGRTLKLKIIEDYLTSTERIAASTQIDSLGRFSLQAYIPYTQQANLQIDYYTSEIFLEPDNHYKIFFAPFDYYQNEKINALVNPHALENLSYRFEKVDTAELNYMIWKFTYEYVRFMDVHFYRIIQGQDSDSLKNFIQQIKATFAYSGHAFFNDYLQYKLANVENFGKLRSGKSQFKTYIQNKTLHYNNPAQMEYLMDTYKNYFDTQIKIPRKKWENMLNGTTPLTGILDSMGHDSSLVNEVIREWVFLYTAHGLLQDENRYNRARVLSLIETLAQTSKFAAHRKIATYILSQAEREYEKKYFSEIFFRDRNDSLIQAKDLLEKGKLHYVAFVSADKNACPDCLVEMTYLKKILPKYSEFVKGIVVNTDYEFARYYHHADTQPYPWSYLHFNKEIDWLKQVEAIHNPSFILVDDQGKILQTNYIFPSNGLEAVFKKIQNNKKLKDEKRKEMPPARY